VEAPAAGPPGRTLAPALVPLEPLRRLGAGPPTPGAVGSGGGVRYGGRSLTDSHHSQTAFRFSAALWSLSISTPHVLHILSRCLAPSTKNSLQWWHFCDVQYSSCQPAGKATSARQRLNVMQGVAMTREGGGRGVAGCTTRTRVTGPRVAGRRAARQRPPWRAGAQARGNRDHSLRRTHRDTRKRVAARTRYTTRRCSSK